MNKLYQRLKRKQGFVELYTQRLIEGNIVRQKLSRPKLYRLRPHRLRLYGTGRGSSEIIYYSISRKKSVDQYCRHDSLITTIRFSIVELVKSSKIFHRYHVIKLVQNNLRNRYKKFMHLIMHKSYVIIRPMIDNDYNNEHSIYL